MRSEVTKPKLILGYLGISGSLKKTELLLLGMLEGGSVGVYRWFGLKCFSRAMQRCSKSRGQTAQAEQGHGLSRELWYVRGERRHKVTQVRLQGHQRGLREPGGGWMTACAPWGAHAPTRP